MKFYRVDFGWGVTWKLYVLGIVLGASRMRNGGGWALFAGAFRNAVSLNVHLGKAWRLS